MPNPGKVVKAYMCETAAFDQLLNIPSPQHLELMKVKSKRHHELSREQKRFLNLVCEILLKIIMMIILRPIVSKQR